MDIETYKKRKQDLENTKPKTREFCITCCQPTFSCYCQHIQKFDPKIKFCILIHPIEQKRRIASGRMAHLCLENSELILGHDYSFNPEIENILNNPDYKPYVLYPGQGSLDISKPSTEKETLFPASKTPVIFVIDGTWATARQTMRLSENIKRLPRICFTPPGPSQFRVRKQPHENCYSTLEAIHHTIELLGNTCSFKNEERTHDRLLDVFNQMVERQLSFVREAYDNPKSTSYRRPKKRVA